MLTRAFKTTDEVSLNVIHEVKHCRLRVLVVAFVFVLAEAQSFHFDAGLGEESNGLVGADPFSCVRHTASFDPAI